MTSHDSIRQPVCYALQRVHLNMPISNIKPDRHQSALQRTYARCSCICWVLILSVQ